MKICPQCNKTYESGKFCLDCGIPLIDEQPIPQQTTRDFNLNLGDANAISGGVSMSDNHSTNNSMVQTTTSNVDSHNVITNHITQIEREKTPEELKHEKELAFRDACQEAYRKGLLTSEQKRKLEDLKYRIGLDDATASKIISEVTRHSGRKSASLSPVHQITFNNIKTAINANRLDMVNRLMAQLKAMAQRYSVEEVQFLYYMLQAVLHPKQCVEEYEHHLDDKYWQTFWSSIAYRRMGSVEPSELLVSDVGDKWADTFPAENVFILATANALIDNDIESAKSLFDNIYGEHSSLLTNLTTCLYILLYKDTIPAEDLRRLQKEGAFYTNNLFAEIMARNEEMSRLREEAEAKRRAEEVKQREEAEAKRRAEEVKQREEAEAKRRAEEAKQREEAESKRRAEEAKQREEAEAKQCEEAKIKEKHVRKRNDESNQSDILTNPSQLFHLKSKTAVEQLNVYKSLLEMASKGNGKAGAYLAYFYIYGIIVNVDLSEAEKRIMSGNYQSDVVLLQLLVDLYTAKNIPALAEIWKRKLANLKK